MPAPLRYDEAAASLSRCSAYGLLMPADAGFERLIGAAEAYQIEGRAHLVELEISLCPVNCSFCRR